MRMWVTCQARPEPEVRLVRQSGFTLLEMIVVLALLGLATAMVLPSTVRGLDSWKRQSAIDSLLDQVRALPGEARRTGRRIDISASSLQGERPPLRHESDWTLQTPRTWSVAANGVCEAGELIVGSAHGSRRIIVEAPFCDARVAP